MQRNAYLEQFCVSFGRRSALRPAATYSAFHCDGSTVDKFDVVAFVQEFKRHFGSGRLPCDEIVGRFLCRETTLQGRSQCRTAYTCQTYLRQGLHDGTHTKYLVEKSLFVARGAEHVHDLIESKETGKQTVSPRRRRVRMSWAFAGRNDLRESSAKVPTLIADHLCVSSPSVAMKVTYLRCLLCSPSESSQGIAVKANISAIAGA